MEDLLIAILQFLLEMLLNAVLELPFDWPSRNTRRESESMSSAWFLWLILGAAVGLASLFVVKHTLIALPALRIANLFASPVVSAMLSQQIASLRARSNPFINPRLHFWRAFWFTLGVVVVRFAYVQRGG